MNKVLMQSGKDDWETPQALFEELDREFHFTLDPCSTHENAKCEKHYTAEENGLQMSWGGRLFSAILHTARPGGKTNGCRSASRKHRSPEPWWLHCFQRGQTQTDSTNTYWARRKSASFAVACALNRTEYPAGQLHSRAWFVSGGAGAGKHGGDYERL